MAKYPSQSPYAGFNNNPIYYRDPTGLEGDPPVTTPVNKIQNIDADMVNSLVDMSGSTSKNTNSLGWPRDSKYYWVQFKDTPLGKTSLSEDNLNLIEKGISPKVDKQWNDAMGKYDLDGKMDEGIEHHHHNKGRTAYPRPRSKHVSEAWNSVLHKVEQRLGKIRQKSGTFSKMARERGTLLRGKLGGLINFFNVADWLIDSPHSSRYMFGNGSETNRAYFDEGSGLYYEIKQINKSGDIKLQFYQDYERIEGEWRGIIKVDAEQWYQKQEDGSFTKPNVE